MSDNDKKTLYLVDGSGFIFRAYHALPLMNRPSDGTPVNAVLGFVNMFVKLLADMNAEYMAVIFDAARKNFRNDIYADYKANRDAPPEDLVPQFSLIREATEAFDLPCLELEGYEADDLIATYAKQAREQGWKVVIVSSDKDLMQLINDDVVMFDPMKGGYMGEEETIKKFGVRPEKVVDVQALAGDSIDNVPGVPGIGVKTAAQLIEEYGDLETLLDRAEEIKQPKRRETLIENAEAARISKQLVRLDTEVDVPCAIDDLKAHDPNTPKLVQFLKDQGFKSVIARLGKTEDLPDEAEDMPQSAPIQGFPKIAENTYTLITTEETLASWVDKIKQAGLVAIDTETTGLTPAKSELVGIALAVKPGEAAYIPLRHGGGGDLFSDGADKPEQLDVRTVIEMLKETLEDPAILKIGHNLKYDFQFLAAEGVRLSPVDDTMLMSYVLDGNSRRHKMDSLSEDYLGHTPIPFEEVAGKGKLQITFDKVPLDKALDYAAEDADVTLRLWHILKPRLAEEKMASVYEKIERPLIPVIADMEWTGIKLDTSRLKQLSQEFAQSMAELETEIYKLAGTEFNVGSPKQIGEILYDNLQLEGAKKTKSGQYATDASTLEKLAVEGHEIVQKILEWRQLSKLRSTYTESLLNEINRKTGRVHTSFSMAGTSTGRLASSDPNLQNIPIRTEEGRKIREAFIADEGCMLLSVDYSQVELRLAAHMAEIEALQKAFKEDQDIHALTASEVFGVPLAEMDSETRRKAKAINFGILYGISAWGLARNLDIEPKEADNYIKAYFKRFPELSQYMEAKKEEARMHGYVRTLFGRKCFMDGIKDKNGQRRSFAERAAINAPVQGTAADLIKRAMGKMPAALKDAGLSARMLLQVHDELIFEVPEPELDKTRDLVIEVMESAAAYSVPLTADAGVGKSWAEAY